MRLHRIVLIAVGVAALVAVAPEAQGGGGTPITSCGQTVTTNAVLKQDLVCTGHGIVVGAQGITIDLKGHTLRGDRSGSHYGIDDGGGYKNVTVKNGVARNFGIGVYALNADKVSVSNVVATGNVLWGILLNNGDNDSITSSAAFGNAAGLGLDSTGGSIKSSTASSNTDVGIDVDGVGASIKSSTASGNGAYGIQVDGSGVSIESSTASGNGVRGIIVAGNVASLEDNKANGNGFAGGASDLSGLGIEVYLFTTMPTGSNTARGNDDPAECSPASLC